MRINQKTLQYILLLAIAAIGFCSYKFGYENYTEKAAAAQKQNQNYEARLAELQGKVDFEYLYDEGIVEAEEISKETLAKYGPGNTPEKTIMMVTMLEKLCGVEISSISFNDSTPIFISEAVDDGENISGVELDKTFISINYLTTYQGLKDMMDFINDYAERMNVASFTAVYNQETGGLSGSMIINLYSVQDPDHEYVAPNISGVAIGTDNIFGTIDSLEDLESAEKGAETVE